MNDRRPATLAERQEALNAALAALGTAILDALHVRALRLLTRVLGRVSRWIS